MKNGLLKSFGDKIKLLRLDVNLSQEKLAEKTGFHRTYIGMVERGERNVSLKNIKKFADVFNVSLEQLMKDVK